MIPRFSFIMSESQYDVKIYNITLKLRILMLVLTDVSLPLCSKLYMSPKIAGQGETINLKHFRPIKPLGCGDTGR